MGKVITIIGKNGVEYSVSLTGEQADYYLRLAQMRASSDSEVMKAFVELLLNSGRANERQNKAQYN